jgi:hypothetical protein
LPEDGRPATDEGHDLVIPQDRSWSGTLDPILYCFSAQDRAALVPGATVKPSFGWPARGAALAEAPFAAAPVGASLGKVAPIKSFQGDTFTVTEAPPPVPPPRGESSAGEDEPGVVTLSVPDSLDAVRGVELGTTVTLTNSGSTPISLLFRPDTLLFTVLGPSGATSCGYPRQGATPIRELFTNVGPKQSSEVGVLFTATCPPGTFDDIGIYRVWPRLDTTGTSGRSIGLRTWDGVAVGKIPLLVRVRTTKNPKAAARPTLD